MGQAEFASLGGVQRRAQVNYEAGERFPDAAYLSAVAGHGVDVRYVLTGERDMASGRQLSEAEDQLLKLFRIAPTPVQQAVMAALAVGVAPPIPQAIRRSGGMQLNVMPGGSVGHVLEGSTGNSGVINQRVGGVKVGKRKAGP